MAEKRTKADKLQRGIERTNRRLAARVEEADVESMQMNRRPASPKEKKAA